MEIRFLFVIQRNLKCCVSYSVQEFWFELIECRLHIARDVHVDCESLFKLFANKFYCFLRLNEERCALAWASRPANVIAIHLCGTSQLGEVGQEYFEMAPCFARDANLGGEVWFLFGFHLSALIPM